MNTPHKHADLIKAWADGFEIECYNKALQRWRPLTKFPSWNEYVDYRIKPKEPVVMFVRTRRTNLGTELYFYHEKESNLKLSYDPDSGELLSVEKI